MAKGRRLDKGTYLLICISPFSRIPGNDNGSFSNSRVREKKPIPNYAYDRQIDKQTVLIFFRLFFQNLNPILPLRQRARIHITTPEKVCIFAFGLSATRTPKAFELIFPHPPTHPPPFVEFFF
jgi:hypothetical protein